MEEQTNTPLSKLISVDLEKEMKKSFLDYSMSVIVARALPDVRDGLKPCLLYTSPGRPVVACEEKPG